MDVALVWYLCIVQLLPLPGRKLCNECSLSVIHSFVLSFVLFVWLTSSGDPIPDMDSGSLVLGDLLAFFLIHSPADFHDTRQNDRRQQDNESTTFWEQSGRHPHTYLHCVSKNVPSLTGYSFNVHPPIFIIFGTCHQQIFKNRLQV